MKGALIRTLRGIDAALNAGEVGFGEREGFAEGAVVLRALSGFDLVTPDLGFRFSEAAELPVGADEDVHVETLLRRLGMEAMEVFRGERHERVGFLAGDDFRWRGDAGFERVHGSTGLARGRAWARWISVR